MTGTLPEPLFARLSGCLSAQIGLHFSADRGADLERGLEGVAREAGLPNLEACVNWLLAAPLTQKQIDLLALELTIGETYFMREKKSLDVLFEQLLPEMKRKREGSPHHWRLWSAGCCTGEEPYTLAILMDRYFPDISPEQITILGTDINTLFLQKANRGVYTEWSFRDAPAWLKRDYFVPVDQRHFAIIPRIKERVTFSYLNLAQDVYPSLANNTNGMDLILCRNVLMYFTPDGIKQVVNGFYRTLVDPGFLLVSPTETSTATFSPFRSLYQAGVFFYQKNEEAAPVFTPLIPTPPAALEEALAPLLSSDSPEKTTYEAALALFEQGNYVQASETLQAETEGAPTAESLGLRARISADLGDLAEAQKWIEKALRANKLNAGLHYLRAIILQELGEAAGAIKTLKHALYLDPNFVLAHFALANLELNQKNFRPASKYFHNVLDLLAPYGPDEVLPHSDGLAAGRLKEMVQSALAQERNS